MRKQFKPLIVMCLSALLLLTSCGEKNSTVSPDDTTAHTGIPAESVLESEIPETDSVVTNIPETATPETDEPYLNTPGDCGNILWSESDNTVGHLRLDAFRHQVSQVEYCTALQGTTVNDWTLTVEEDSGIFEIRGWVGMNITDFELGWRIGTHNEVEFRNWSVSPVSREAAVYAAAQSEGHSNATGFVYYFDIADFKSGEEVHLLMKDKDTDKIYCFSEITVNIKGADETVDPAVLEKYELGQNSSLDLNIPDPIANHEPVIAPDDDSSLKLWFDHITEKVARYDVSGKDSDRTSYTIQMGKNEMEGCQFFLYSPTAKKVTIKVSDFVNDKGETLPSELGVEYYIEDGYITHNGYPAEYVYPDAVIPYDSYVAYTGTSEHGCYGNDKDSKLKYGSYICVGPFSASASDHTTYPFRESVRGFVLQTETTKDTTPGAYKATVEIYDADTGKCIKMANVYTYVYNVTLSDETALDTAFGLWDITSIYKYHYSSNAKLTKYSDSEITRAVADFFLKNRITLTGSVSFFNTMGQEWFENPRVTSVRVLTKDQYDSLKDIPSLAKKMFYYGQDEPAVPRGWRPITWPDGTEETVYDNTGLLSVLAVSREADMLKNVWGWEDYRLVTPFERTIDFTTFDFDSIDTSSAFPEWYEQYRVTDERD
ncbi:MAG: hypothetical protein E7638_08380, partial [Ruminococcaceae bacterium]|nr:hypothetical protein [Oscillospiraceae bacterium]